MKLKQGRGILGRSGNPLTWTSVFGEDAPARSYSGKTVNELNALKYSAVWACVTLIADAVSSLPPEAIVENPDTGSIVTVPLPQWIRRPHPALRRNEVWNQLLVSLLLWGNGYGLIARRPSDNVPVGLAPLDPMRVQCEWDPDRPGFRRYRIDGGTWLTSQDVFHVMGPSLPGSATGMSVIRHAREAIGLGLTLEEFGSRYFAQGSMAKVVIKVPNKQLGTEQARDIVNMYERFHRGPGNWHRPAVLSGGGEIQNISIPPDDAQFLQSREHQAVDITRWFRVPPHRVSIIAKQSSWGSGLAEENTAMVQNTYRPWIMRFESAFTAYVPGGEDSGMRIRLNDASLLRGSFKEQVDAWQKAVVGQIATPNEARNAIGLDPIEGGDKLITPPQPSAPPASDSQPPQDDTKDGGKRSDPPETRHPGHPNQKVHGRKGGGLITDGQWEAILPDTPGTTAKKARAALASSEIGQSLVDVVTRFQNDMSEVSSLHKDFMTYANGKGSKLPKKRKLELTSVMDGISHAPVSPTIYRGVRMPDGFDTAALSPGKAFVIPPSSFSSSEKLARGFAKQKVGTKTTPVVYRISEGARALPVEVFGDSAYKSEHEWISGGQYTVKNVEKKKDGSLLVDVEHSAMFSW